MPLRIAVGITMLVLLLAGGAGAATITVDDSGGADYIRIQDAINNAASDDTILVYEGTYFEHVNVTKQLILRGMETGAGKPVVDAGRSGDAITLSADNITLDGFNATNASSWYAGIMVSSNNNTLIGNEISGNNYGINLWYSGNNTINGNNISTNGIGIVLYSSGKNTLHGNNIQNSSYSIYMFSSSDNNTIFNNIFNSTNNLGLSGMNNNTWNTTKTESANIVNGPYIGGNFWLVPDGMGYSLTCTDADRDGICDSNYALTSENTDYLPLASARYNVSGNVTNSSTGSGISGARIELVEYPGYNATTNSTGYYNMSIPAGTYNIIASCQGYAPDRKTIIVDGDRRLDFICNISSGIFIPWIAYSQTDWYTPIQIQNIDT
ncbi:Periplasmic copper-binding protein (NosD) [uncultured archaeon]|nr:Periplasmic copper-binding protein (NosD) [uncultured archaeon]